MTKIEQLAEELVNTGLTMAFGISGSGPSYQLITALLDRGVTYIPVSHEATGPIAAGVFSFETGIPAAAISIKGPGFINLLAGITAAWFERYPLYAISEDYPDDQPLERMHKRLPQVEMIKPICTTVSSLSQIDDLKGFLKFQPGNEEPHLFELCELNTTNSSKEFESFESFAHAALSPQLMESVASAQKPLLIVGSLFRRLGIQEELNKLKLPILTSVQAKGILNEQNGNIAGIYTGAGKELVVETHLIKEADLVITIGLRNHEILNIEPKKAFLNIDIISSTESPKPYVVNPHTIIEILEVLKPYENWAAEIIGASRIDLRNYVEKNEWMPGSIFQLLADLEFDHGLVLDTGTFCTIGEHVWSASPERPFLGSSNGRNMGIAIPSALGFALAHPNLPVFCALGDGGIRYYPSELQLFAHKNLPVCFLYMTDGQFGSIACNIKEAAYKEQILSPPGNSWHSIVQAIGIESYVINNLNDLATRLNKWDKRRPLFLELPFDQEMYNNIAKPLR